MSISRNNLSEFRKLTHELRDQYRVVDESVTQIYQHKNSLASTDDLERVNGQLNEVKTIEAKLQPIRKQMELEGQQVPNEMKSVIDETVQIVMGLIPRIADLEQSAIESRDKLAPLIHEGVRAIDMKNAYQKR